VRLLWMPPVGRIFGRGQNRVSPSWAGCFGLLCLDCLEFSAGCGELPFQSFNPLCKNINLFCRRRIFNVRRQIDMPGA